MGNAKMLILNNKQDSSFKAVLNLKFDSPSLIKFYNLSNNNKRLALGVKQGKNVVKVPLDINENNCQFVLPKNVDINENLFCAVVDVTNAFCPEIVLSGSLNSEIENTKIENAFVATKPEDNSVLYEEEPLEKIEELIDKNLQDDATSNYFDACSNCRYRQAFYDGAKCCSSNTKLQKNNENSQNNMQNVIFDNSLDSQYKQELDKNLNSWNINKQSSKENSANSNSGCFKQDSSQKFINGGNCNSNNFSQCQNANFKQNASFNYPETENFIEFNKAYNKNLEDVQDKSYKNCNCNHGKNMFNMEGNNGSLDLNSSQSNLEQNLSQNYVKETSNDMFNNYSQNLYPNYSNQNYSTNSNSTNDNSTLNTYNNQEFSNGSTQSYPNNIAFTSGNDISINSNEDNFELEDKVQEDYSLEPQTFYEQIKSQLDNLFSK